MNTGRLQITKYSVALLAIVLIGLFLRIYHLTAQSIWFDEAVSVWAAKMDLLNLISAIAAADLQPPLYFVLLHGWIGLFGDSEFAVRLLSVLFGVLAIPMMYVLGRLCFDKEAGLWGALILAVSSFNIQFSQEARTYSLMVLLALLSMYIFLRLLRGSTRALSIAYVLCTTLLVYAHVYGWFVIIAQDVYLAIMFFVLRKKTLHLRRWAALQAIVVALFSPWIGVLIQRISWVEQGFWISSPTVSTMFATFRTYAGTVLLLVLFVALSAFSFFTYKKASGAMDWKAPLKALESYTWHIYITNIETECFLVVWLLTLNLLPFIISRLSTPIYLDKYTIAASLALYLLVAKGIRNINWRYAKASVIAVIIVLSAANLQAFYVTPWKPLARDAVNAVNENAQSGDLVIVYPQHQALVFNYYDRRPDLTVTPAVKPFDFWSGAENSVQDNVKETQSNVIGHDRVWLVHENYETGTDWQVYNAITKTMNESYELSYAKHVLGYDVYLFEKRT